MGTLIFISGQEIFVIMIVVLLLFGADKIPEIARGLGKGMRDFKKAMDLNPGSPEVIANRAYARLEMGAYKEAIEDYTMLVRNNPDQTDYYFKRGVCRINLKQYDEALEDLNQCTELNPGNATAYYYISLIYNKLNDYKQALKYALKAKSMGYAVAPGYLEGLRSK